jgi:lipoprotein-anchoring transpeptidase ErfK/SrfK
MPRAEASTGWSALLVALSVAAILAAGCTEAALDQGAPDQGALDRPDELARAESDPQADGISDPVAANDSASGPADSQGSAPALGATHEVVVGQAVVEQVVAYVRPDETAAQVAELTNPTAVGGPLVFALVDPEPPAPGQEWVEVQLPIRPNGSTGWVQTDQLSLTVNPYRIEIDVSEFRLEVYRRGELWLSTEVAIGTGSTPTPRGRFYITELLQPPNPDGLYGPYAFGLSGYSERLTSFNGGDGVIGIHGTDEPERIGTEVSHGCIRLPNQVITELASVLPLGTPVHIAD